MSPTLTAPAFFTVTDSAGRTLRVETLEIGTNVMDRLRTARSNYQAQGWECQPLRPPRWNFAAEKSGRHIVIAVRALPEEHILRQRSAANH